MALEVNFTKNDNIFIDEDKTLRFYVTTSYPVKLTEDVEQGDTSINVDPIVEGIASGALIRFGRILLTTTAATQEGDTAIPISATTGKILKGAIGRVVQDVTGWTFSFIVKNHPEATSSLFSINPSIASASQGAVDVVILDTYTDSLAPKEYYYKFRRIDSGFETVLAFGTLFLRG